MTFPEPGSGPTFEYDDIWEDVPYFSPEFEARMKKLGDEAADLYKWLSGDLVC